MLVNAGGRVQNGAVSRDNTHFATIGASTPAYICYDHSPHAPRSRDPQWAQAPPDPGRIHGSTAQR
jgi:hypothetical protein